MSVPETAPHHDVSRPSARVVLVNWRRPDLTERAVASLRHQLREGDRLVVVDNASGDGSADCLRDAGIEVVESPVNGGFGAGVNLGAAGMSEDVLVLLNNDAVAEDGFLDALLAPLAAPPSGRLGATTALLVLAGRYERLPAQSLSGGSLVSREGTRWRRLSPEREAAREGLVLVNSTGNAVDASGNGYDRDWLTPLDELMASAQAPGLCGGACAIRREAWEEVGGFREDLFMYYEDTDLSYRLHGHGWRIGFVRDAVALHEHAASSGTDSPLFVRVNARNRLVVAGEHAPWPVVGRAVGRSLVRLARSGPRSAAGRGVLEGLRALPGALRRR